MTGTLAGSMHPTIYDEFDSFFVDFGRYDFTQTNYAKGGTTFAGAFVVPGLPDATPQSFFEGAFTGPGGAEVLARWQAPFVVSGDWSIPDGTKGVLSGIWIGKKD